MDEAQNYSEFDNNICKDIWFCCYKIIYFYKWYSTKQEVVLDKNIKLV